MLKLSQYFLRTFNPRFHAALTRLVYRSSRVKIGRGFTADSVPRILIDADANLEIGSNVEFRRSIEIRVHGTAKITISDGVRIDRGVRRLAANNAHIRIGPAARIGLYSVLNGGDSITIGSKALISGFVYLQTSMHEHRASDVPIQDQGYAHAPVTLGDDTWVGTHVVIMPGITVAEGAVVGSNAVVTSNVEAHAVVAGVPAREIRQRVGK
jgi:acetyltransferase-like isoleucine patch superfamily enzyme